MLKALIVDDEKYGREGLLALLNKYCPQITQINTASNIADAKDLILSEEPDLVFLDIEIKNELGFDLLEKIESWNFEVIFTTAHPNYAVRAFKYSGLDYLLKPINAHELVRAVKRAIKKKDDQVHKQQIELLLKNLNSDKKAPQTICLSTMEGVEFIDIDEIVYCEANGAYTVFHLKPNRKIIVSRNLKEYEVLLDEDFFMRIHNSFLINLKEVKKYVKSDGGYVIMKNGDAVNISQKKKDDFLQKMRYLT
jgi:two-component system LytT family response regulator